jgi:hypothetical protein
MDFLGRLCNCSLCAKSSYKNKKQGFWHPCGCPVSLHDTFWIGGARHGLGAQKHPIQGVVVDGKIYDINRIVQTGGRCALWIYLDNTEDYLLLPANQVGDEITNLNGIPVQVINRFPASVHGCYKVKLNQELIIFKEKGGKNAK